MVAAHTVSHAEMEALTQRHLEEMQKLKDEKQQLALTVCELEESLDRATTKVKEYKSDVTSLERTLAGLCSSLAVCYSKLSCT